MDDRSTDDSTDLRARAARLPRLPLETYARCLDCGRGYLPWEWLAAARAAARPGLTLDAGYPPCEACLRLVVFAFGGLTIQRVVEYMTGAPAVRS